MVLACASGNQDNDPNTTQSEAPTSVVRLLKGTSALLAGEWTIDKTFAAVSSPSPIDCLSADIQFLQARAGNTGPLRIDANVTFTCVGASILSPPTWKGLRPEDIYIEDAAGNQSRNTGIGGIFGKNVTKPEVDSKWAGWLEFDRPGISEGTLYLYLGPSSSPISFLVSPPPPTPTLPPTAAPTPTRIPTPVVEPECPPGEPCVSLYSINTRVPLGQSVLLKLSIVNSIGKPPMTAHLLLRVPNGWHVHGMGFAQACTGLCNAVYDVKPGGNRSIEITLQPAETGIRIIQGRLEWSFEEGEAPIEGQNLSLRIEVTPPN